MVRRMVAVLLEVGQGTMNEDTVRAALAGPERAFDGARRPAKGLTLPTRDIRGGDGQRTNGALEER
jgi:tRNA U38,U39,U40 pseudouridine synthase TruA